MNWSDVPTSCPVVNELPLRYSIGWYRGRHRIVIAWFADACPALDYLRRMRISHPHFKIDMLESLF